MLPAVASVGSLVTDTRSHEPPPEQRERVGHPGDAYADNALEQSGQILWAIFASECDRT